MWYKIVEKICEKIVTVEFTVREDGGDDRHWTLAEVAANPLAYDFRGKNVEIRGKAALWMYAHAALRAFAGGADSIAVFNAMSQKSMPIYPLDAAVGTVAVGNSFFSVSSPAGADCILHIAGKNWELGDLPQFGCFLHEWLVQAGSVDLMIDTGARCPNWLLAFVVLECARAGVSGLEYFDIRDSVAIDVRRLTQRSCSMPEERKKHRIAVGVVGTPIPANRFSRLFSSRPAKRQGWSVGTSMPIALRRLPAGI